MVLPPRPYGGGVGINGPKPNPLLLQYGRGRGGGVGINRYKLRLYGGVGINTHKLRPPYGCDESYRCDIDVDKYIIDRNNISIIFQYFHILYITCKC